MPLVPSHIAWLQDTGQRISTPDGPQVAVLELNHLADTAVLSNWAKHFREHYQLDTALDDARDGTGLNRREYLLQLVFPHQNAAPGPSIRAGDFASETAAIPASQYIDNLNTWSTQLLAYFSEGTGREQTITSVQALRKLAYMQGTPRELLYADLISAVTRKRLRNAARFVLPSYSGLPASSWKEPFSKPRFMRELWPSQHVFGERGVLQGRSAVIQMPTSAGKTRGIELILRSAFYADRARLAVVVAPFRALCTEITGAMREAFRTESVQLNELSDALLVDYSSLLRDLFDDDGVFSGFELAEQKHVIVLTPEKLLYVLRHSPELVNAIGLVVYDEGHQFDSGQRGVTYELLLTSIKRFLPADKQIVLISAVITNAEAIGHWLVGDEVVLIEGSELSTTRRSVAFASWSTPLGQLQFVDPQDPEHVDYFVPRLIEQRSDITPSRTDAARLS